MDEEGTESPIDRLNEAWATFSMDLRVWRRSDEAAYARIKNALVELESQCANADWLPKELVITLVELVPAMETLSLLFEGTKTQQVQDTGFELQELVRRCVGTSNRTWR